MTTMDINGDWSHDDEEDQGYDFIDLNDSDGDWMDHTGTSQCPGTCQPCCDWCLVSHLCHEDCGGGDACPYVGLRDVGGGRTP